MLRIVLDDNLTVLRALAAGSVDLVYIDPPFNTGRKAQTRVALRTVRAMRTGDRTGFQGRRYRSDRARRHAATVTAFDDYLAFLEPAPGSRPTGCSVRHGLALLSTSTAARAHYCKVLLDGIFGPRELRQRDRLGLRLRRQAESGAGRPSTTPSSGTPRTPRATPSTSGEIDRIPYMAPKLVGAEKAAQRQDAHGRLVAHHRAHQLEGEDRLSPPRSRSACWSASSRVHSAPGDALLDFFAGSGTFGEAAALHNRDCLLVDDNLGSGKDHDGRAPRPLLEPEGGRRRGGIRQFRYVRTDKHPALGRDVLAR